jgi:hypothetical protein
MGTTMPQETGFVIVGPIRLPRRVWILPDRLAGAQPNWGLRGEHRDKHLFGDSAYALRNIDPDGTTDDWVHHLSDLFQRPATAITRNGMLDIIGRFPKKGGGGDFQLGVRLSPRPDGTFDLITLLTAQ